MLRRRHRTGFSIVELGLVVTIIVFLVAILIPTVGWVRRSARETETRAVISRLGSGIRMYFDDHRAYPGFYSNVEIAGAATDAGTLASLKPTSAENLVISMLGGFEANGSFSSAAVGRGMYNINPRNPKRWRTYIDVTAQDLSAGKLGTLDTRVPEFLDRCQAGAGSVNLPILYLRAKVGAAGVAGAPSGDFQYDPTAIDAYYRTNTVATSSVVFENVKNKYPTAAVYFGDSVANQAANKDTFLLISAGSDGIYATKDDITNFRN